MTTDAHPDTAPAAGTRVRGLARGQVTGLMVQFLLGMVIEVAGLPSRASGGAHLTSVGALVVHVLVAAGLAAGAAVIVRAAAQTPDWRQWLARAGAAAIGVSIASGILTLVTSSGWWSYAMAVGFTAALAAYGGLLIPVT